MHHKRKRVINWMSLKFKSSFLKNTAKENEKKSHRPGEDICQMHI